MASGYRIVHGPGQSKGVEFLLQWLYHGKAHDVLLRDVDSYESERATYGNAPLRWLRAHPFLPEIAFPQVGSSLVLSRRIAALMEIPRGDLGPVEICADHEFPFDPTQRKLSKRAASTLLDMLDRVEASPQKFQDCPDYVEYLGPVLERMDHSLRDDPVAIDLCGWRDQQGYLQFVRERLDISLLRERPIIQFGMSSVIMRADLCERIKEHLPSPYFGVNDL